MSCISNYLIAFCTALFLFVAAPATYAAERFNVLLITADDLSAESLGSFGCKLPGTSPNIDRLASQSMRFNYAHVVCANCMPSRNALYSGRYPHNNRVEGFYQVPDPGFPVMADLMKSAGYFTAIFHKVSHSTPYSPYDWDLVLGSKLDNNRADVRDPASFKTTTTEGIAAAKSAGKPFCLVINIADPHKPFYSEGRRGRTAKDLHAPSRVFKPKEVPIPGYLFDDAVVRKEMANYYSSVRRADDAVGRVLEALTESGQADRTIVIFLSDHGMGMPFVKTELYHHSTRTPLIVHWPGVINAGAVDRDHLISAVDFLPTLLDIVGVADPDGLDGRSFEPLLRGKQQQDRDFVIKEYNENSGGHRNPMRAVQTKRYLYIFNPWADGKRVMHTATHGTATYARLKHLAKTDQAMAKRLDDFDHRVLEELFDVEQDPDCLRNLINDPAHQSTVVSLRKTLEEWMEKTADPALDALRHRADPTVREAYMQRVEKESANRGAKSKPKGGKRRADAD